MMILKSIKYSRIRLKEKKSEDRILKKIKGEMLEKKIKKIETLHCS
jgi:hypothetical protein